MSRMPIILGKDIDGRAFPEYVWNSDLIYFDGPLLSLYKREATGSDALFFWLDTDGKVNRWGVVEIARSSLFEYLKGQLSLRNVIKSANFTYIFNMGKKRRTNIKLLNNLPEQYLPNEDSFLFPEISTEEAKSLIDDQLTEYKLLLSGDDLYVEDLSSIPKLYQQLYSFHYGIGHLDRPAVKDRLVNSVRDWTGGFSSVHLFNGMRAVTPSIHRARVSNLHYASPGHIGMELLPKMAREISMALSSLMGEGYEKMETAYSECYRYFRKEKISGFEEGDERRADSLTEEQIKTMRDIVNYLVQELKMPAAGEAFSNLNIDVLGQLRAILAYYRRLRKLHLYIENGMLTVPAL